MTNVAIFGCGIVGKRACAHLRSKYKVAVFLDNNRRLHGSRLFGVTVHDPESYDYRQLTHVFIASMYVDEILVQLLSLGVPSSKIDYVGEEIRMKSTAELECSWPRLAPCFNLLRKAFYVSFRFSR